MCQISNEAIRHEEELASQRNPDEDFDSFMATLNQLREVIDQVAKLKEEGKNEKHSEEMQELKKKGSLLFLKLKQLNRLDKYRWRDAREAVNGWKEKVDVKQLELENTLYEVMHLQKERKKCLEFR